MRDLVPSEQGLMLCLSAPTLRQGEMTNLEVVQLRLDGRREDLNELHHILLDRAQLSSNSENEAAKSGLGGTVRGRARKGEQGESRGDESDGRLLKLGVRRIVQRKKSFRECYWLY